MYTTFLAKLLGLWIVITIVGMAANREGAVATLKAFFADPALMWVAGVFTLLVGLAIVLIHNRWSGGALPIIVTFYGWAAAVKGLLFVCLPAPAQEKLYDALHFQQYFYGYSIVALVLGAYLVYGGFKASASPRA